MASLTPASFALNRLAQNARRRKAPPKPPEPMTWPRAVPFLAAAGMFDLLRYFFLFLWFTAPTLGAFIAKAYVTHQYGAFAGWVAAAAVGGVIVSVTPFLIAFGSVMALAVGFMGWLIMTGSLAFFDLRLFTKNPWNVFWLFEGLGASTAVMVWGLFRTQIREERKALEAWKAAHKDYEKSLAREQNEYAAYMRVQDIAQQEAEMQAEEQEANDNESEQQEQERLAA